MLPAWRAVYAAKPQKLFASFFQKRTAFLCFACFFYQHASAADTNWTALRAVYAASSEYDPFMGAGPVQAAIEAALQRGDAKGAARLAEQALRVNWMDVRTHLLASAADRQSGQKVPATVHEQVTRGISQAIESTGTGTSPGAAIHVLSPSEEMAAVADATVSLRDRQRVEIEGHWYDVLTLRQVGNHTLHTAYFNVDVPVARAAQPARARTASSGGGRHN